MAFVPVSLQELRAKLGIETDSRGYIDCPFCKGKKKLHFSDERQDWNCFVCHSSGKSLAFYSKYVLGIELPDDKTERSKISDELQKFMGYDDPQTPRPKVAPIPTRPKRLPASDSQCHAVYTAMASLAMFQLHPDHKKELKRRGLSGPVIEQNGYRTFPFKTNIPPHIVALYNSVDPKLRRNHSEKQAAHIQMGLLVAQLLQEKGHKLDGIPGFYKFGNHWCLFYLPGLMIPTRNIYGEIIRWQVRCNYGDAKYRTFSCKELPGAVTDDIARCHFPLKNTPLSKDIRVIFTEGPLKADVAISLSDDPCAYMAIPGVNMYEALMRHCEQLKQAGVTEVYNALDMDKLTNRNVREGSAKIEAEFAQRGLRVIPMYWAQQYAAQQLMLYMSIAYARGIQIPAHNYRLSVFEKLNLVADALNRADIDPGRAAPGAQHWESETKGIDDYLYSCLVRQEHHQTARKGHIQNYHTLLKNANA